MLFHSIILARLILFYFQYFCTAMNVTATVNSQVSCRGGSDGKVTVNAEGGVPPYTYEWSPTSNRVVPITSLLKDTRLR